GFVSLVTDDSRVETLANLPVQYRLGPRTLFGPAGGDLLFTFNETNGPRVLGPGVASRKPYVKDAFHHQICQGEAATNPPLAPTKAALHYRFDAVPPGGSAVLRLRLTDQGGLADPLPDA